MVAISLQSAWVSLAREIDHRCRFEIGREWLYDESGQARLIGGCVEANTTVGEEGVPLARRKLLAIDGGGIRGIIPATALVKLEQTTGQLTRDIFAFVAGTSTGAIIAAGIAAGVPAQRILDLYVTRSPEVLTQRP